MTTDERPNPFWFDKHYFTRMYAGEADPWGFETTWYEHRKYALTLAALPEATYRRGVEPGCANGVLSELLAARCASLTSFDFIAEVVERARQRLAQHSHVEVVEADFPSFWPQGSGDLVVWSEVAYYLTAAGRMEAERGLRDWLQPNGSLVAVHYTGPTNYPASGTEVGRWLDAMDFLERRSSLRDPDFEIGVWRRRPNS